MYGTEGGKKKKKGKKNFTGDDRLQLWTGTKKKIYIFCNYKANTEVLLIIKTE